MVPGRHGLKASGSGSPWGQPAAGPILMQILGLPSSTKLLRRSTELFKDSLLVLVAASVVLVQIAVEGVINYLHDTGAKQSGLRFSSILLYNSHLSRNTTQFLIGRGLRVRELHGPTRYAPVGFAMPTPQTSGGSRGGCANAEQRRVVSAHSVRVVPPALAKLNHIPVVQEVQCRDSHRLSCDSAPCSAADGARDGGRLSGRSPSGANLLRAPHEVRNQPEARRQAVRDPEVTADPSRDVCTSWNCA